jgi:glycogen debranching enzyme
MDVKIGDWVVTPRRGKPVEVQALWYNALRVMELLAHVCGDTAGQQRYTATSLSRSTRDSTCSGIRPLIVSTM